MPRYDHGWNIVAFTALLQVFSVGVFFYGFGVLLVPWSDSLHVARSDLAIIPIAMQISVFVISPFAGRAIDRVSPRLLMLVGIAAMFGALVLMSRAGSMASLLVAYTLLVPIGQMWAGTLMAQSLSAKWFSRRRGLALAIAAAGGGMGGMVMPPVMQALIDAYGWQQALLYLAAALLVILLPGLPIVRLPRLGDPLLADSAGATQPERSGDIKICRILLDPVFQIITIATGLALAVQLALSFNLPAMGRDIGAHATASAVLLSLLAGTSMGSKPVWGLLMDRLQPRLVFLAMTFGYLLSLALVIIGLEIRSYPAFAGGAIAVGFAAGGVQALLGVVLANRFGGSNFGKAIGLAYPVMNISALGPVTASASFRIFGSYVPGLAGMGCALAAIAVLVVLKLRTAGRTE